MTRETLSKAAKRMGLTRARLHNLALQGRLPGAKQDPISGWWLVPSSLTREQIGKLKPGRKPL